MTLWAPTAGAVGCADHDACTLPGTVRNPLAAGFGALPTVRQNRTKGASTVVIVARGEGAMGEGSMLARNVLL